MYLLPEYKMTCFIIVACLIYYLPLITSSTSASINAPTVNTTDGPVRGSLKVLPTNKTVKRFLGIPFAKADRLEYPVPPDKWTTTLHANSTDKICPQLPFDPRISENCLQLNVYVPLNVSMASLLPVMLWIHGGAYVAGDAGDSDGSVLATEGEVIVVVAAYRLGALGFLSADSDGLRGNYGLMDQIEAMKWVNKNIKRFGGDPEKVTIFGYSAGAMSLGLLMLSPLTSGLYQNVIMQSGTAVALFSALERSEADDRARSFAKAVGCEDIASLKACVKTKSLQEILVAQFRVILHPNLPSFAPVVDGYVLPDTPAKLLQEGRFNKSNILLGVTRDDGSRFAAGMPGEREPLNVTHGMSRALFKKAFNERQWIRNQNKQQSEALIYEYTDWSNVNNVYVTRQQLSNAITDAIFKAPAGFSAKAFTKKQSPTYYYQFEGTADAVAKSSWLGIPHGAELGYVFGGPLVVHKNWTTAADIQLSKDVMTFWTNFAKTGNPNSPLPVTTNWPQYTADKEEYMGLSDNLTVRSKMRADKIALWNTFLPKLQLTTKTNETGENATTPATTTPEKGDKGSTSDKLVTVLAILTGVSGALAVILLVVMIGSCCKRKRQGNDLEQTIGM